jgi:hypothetical protein
MPGTRRFVGKVPTSIEGEDSVIHRRLVLVLAFGLIVAACGGDGDGDAAALSDAIADAMMESVDADTPFERDQAECFGNEVVDRMGVDRLVAVGLSVEDIEGGAEPGSVDLSDEDVTNMTDAITECIDFGQLVVDEMTADLTISAESAQCLVDGINEADFLRTFAESSFLDDEVPSELEGEMLSTLFDLLGECLTPDELNSLGG